MIDDEISAMTAAWLVSMAAVTLLFVALALEPMWNTGLYLEGLRQALIIEQQF
jgi:hypothetical protein